MEIWKDIVGYEGKYQVSNLGKVKSLDYRNTGKEKVIRQYKQKNGYLQVKLHKNSKQKNFKVHRLVATVFIPNPENKPCIDHLNTIRDDNRAENLKWCTAKENANNPISKKNSPTAGKFGKDHYKSKAVYQYSLDGKLIRVWGAIMDVKRELGFDQGSISKCCLGKLKTCYGFVWKYA